jgi:hypothetical protein
MVAFAAGDGVTVPVLLAKVNGTNYGYNVVVPALPVESLFLDDYLVNAIGDNLLYNPTTDRFAKPRSTAQAIVVGTALSAVPVYSTVGGGSFLNAACIAFRTEGGVPVLYNPALWDGSAYTRITPTPALVPSVFMLNPLAILYKAMKRLSDSGGHVVTMTSEKGDGVHGFKVENLDFTVATNGLCVVSTIHA